MIILVIALLVLGPNEIPKIAKTLGRGMRELERAKNELKDSINFEMEESEAREKKTPEKNETPEGEENKESTVENPTSNSHV